MGINIDLIYQKTLQHYEKAYGHLVEQRSVLEHYQSSAISDVIPGFEADKLEFGSYDKENFAVLFVDMRGSTRRAENVGAEKTFLTMHVFLTALIEVVKYYKGKVIDIMGDGLMVFWGGRVAREKDGMNKIEAIKNAGCSGLAMLKVVEKVINRIIQEKALGAPIHIGVGIDFGSVIVTKIGIKETYDVKAFGDCINNASHFSRNDDKVKVSAEVKNTWPTSENGTLRFVPTIDGYYL